MRAGWIDIVSSRVVGAYEVILTPKGMKILYASLIRSLFSSVVGSSVKTFCFMYL